MQWKSCAGENGKLPFFLSGIILSEIPSVRINDKNRNQLLPGPDDVRAERRMASLGVGEGNECTSDFISILGDGSTKYCGRAFMGVKSKFFLCLLYYV